MAVRGDVTASHGVVMLEGDVVPNVAGDALAGGVDVDRVAEAQLRDCYTSEHTRSDVVDSVYVFERAGARSERVSPVRLHHRKFV